jgi:Tfp pilus assembly protein PilF
MNRFLIALCVVAFIGCATTGGGPDKAKMAEGYYNKGLAHLQAGDLELAYVEFHRAVQTDDKNKMSLYALGLIRERQGKFDEAETFYKEALDIDKNFSEAYNALGVVYSRQQRWKEALRNFKKALENKLYTTPHIPYLNMGDMYMAQRDYAMAINAYRESKNFVNQDLTVYRLGMALLEAGRTKEAIAELREGVKMSPNYADMRLALGLAYLREGDKRNAMPEFQRVIELAPKSEAARTARDYLTTLQKKPGK